jgi:endothelin-converting enzyme
LLDRDRRDPDSLFSALMHPTRPLSNLEKVLAAGSIILLLLMSTFIGLFAGAEVQLKKERAGKGHGGTGTVTTTWTETATATSTKVATTTVGSVPTGKPEAVSDMECSSTVYGPGQFGTVWDSLGQFGGLSSCPT